jgi:hypothetical protein
MTWADYWHQHVTAQGESWEKGGGGATGRKRPPPGHRASRGGVGTVGEGFGQQRAREEDVASNPSGREEEWPIESYKRAATQGGEARRSACITDPREERKGRNACYLP